jgi:hypothetical protein
MKNKSILGLLAFASLLISAIVYLLDFLSVNSGILPIISQGILIFVVLFLAWEYVKGLSNLWQIIFYVIAILVIIGFVFGRAGITI